VITQDSPEKLNVPRGNLRDTARTAAISALKEGDALEERGLYIRVNANVLFPFVVYLAG